MMANLDTTTKESPTKTIDPVCGMVVKLGRTRLVSIYKGDIYWFCAEGCRDAFAADPDKYLESKRAEKKGWFGRWLNRMAKSNKKKFGPTGPKCCH
jgi:YHS domain-containing protein